MKKKLVSIAMGLMLAASLMACGANSQQNQTAWEVNNTVTTEVVEEATTEESVTEAPTMDRAGNTIVVPEEITSIVSLAPSMTEVLLDLGMADKIVAIDTNSVGREGLSEELPAFDLTNPDIEKLIEINPSVIFVSNLSTWEGEEVFKPLIDFGICVVCIPSSESIQAIMDDITFIGQVVGATEESEKIVSQMKEEMDAIKAIGDTVEEKKTVFFEIAAAPYIYSFGSDVFLNEMIEMIGAKNILADQKGWMAVEPETVVNANADVILTNVNYIENPTEEIKAREGWEEMTAIKEGQVYYIDNTSSSLPNHNIIKALKEMAKAVYPDLYE